MPDDFEVTKTDDEWRQQLTPDEFRIARQKGTEPAFSGRYWDCKDDGVYLCIGCGEELYDSATKFDSGSGWPSFYQACSADSVITETDTSHGMIRTELMCGRCGSHLGHVFDDGPKPTGKRHCINSASLRLRKSSSDADSPESKERDGQV